MSLTFDIWFVHFFGMLKQSIHTKYLYSQKTFFPRFFSQILDVYLVYASPNQPKIPPELRIWVQQKSSEGR